MNVIEFTDDNFQKEVLDAKGTVIVDFYADWCGPCKMMVPIFDDAAKEAGDKAKFGKLDVDANPKTAQTYGVMSIPTIIVFENGEKTEQLMGIQDKETLLKLVS